MSSSSSSPTMSSPCCENGRSLVNPHTGQTVCSCQYPAGLLTYSRVGLTDPVYQTSGFSTPQGYMPLGTDPSSFYPSLNSPYELKEAGETWRSIGQPPGCYPYDPSSMPPYPYPNAFGGMDINSAARRKNATRENTNTLKAWLFEHRKNPYPTKGEKIMLAIITKMTLTQVSTWFANARRRLKKENKMTWSPRNKPGENDDVDDDDSKDKGDNGADSEDEPIEKSPKEERKHCEREVQHHREDTATPPSSSSRRMYESHSHSEPAQPPRPHISGQCHVTDSGIPRSAVAYPLPQECPQPQSFLHLPPAPHGYSSVCPPGPAMSANGGMASSGSAQAAMDSAASSLKSPDSLCSNSDDSGLSDVNCGYPESAHGSMDGLRPKIWSLAHVATSDAAGYVTPASNGMNSSSLSPMARNLPSHIRGHHLGPMSNGGMASAHIGSGHIGQDMPHPIIPPSPSIPSSGMSTPSSTSLTSLHCGFPQWGPMYGGSPSLGFGKPSCQGPLFSQQIPSMHQTNHMASGQTNSLGAIHSTSAAAAASSYNQNLGSSLSYYGCPKSVMD
ncbi:hypothetical protein Btru_046221 [Bulinus truncatus]|nr:hypothetical protein Btru_046221 [Bulinus truncatus]